MSRSSNVSSCGGHTSGVEVQALGVCSCVGSTWLAQLVWRSSADMLGVVVVVVGARALLFFSVQRSCSRSPLLAPSRDASAGGQSRVKFHEISKVAV